MCTYPIVREDSSVGGDGCDGGCSGGINMRVEAFGC